MKPIRVLSLFDGISCGQVALERANIPVEVYWASEIEKNAISVANYHYNDTIQLGDITNWKLWNIDLSTIDLVMMGSPCQDLSSSGKRKGLKGERSGLFYVAVDILNDIKYLNPNVKFLAENVQMDKIWENIFTNELGVEPIHINSRLVSAQDRKRLYWCNWDVTQPEDKNISFSDIVEDGWFCASMRGRRIKNGHRCDYDKTVPIEQHIECRKDNKSNCCTTVSKDNVAVPVKVPRQKASETKWRYLSPVEYERLQTLPDNYTAIINSDFARRKLCGNGWTVDVIVHLLNCLKEELE